MIGPMSSRQTCRYCQRALTRLFKFDAQHCSITCRARALQATRPFGGTVIAW